MINPSACLVQAQHAIYHIPQVRQYRGNPFIEALPPLLPRDEARDLMRVLPDYDDADRELPATEREHLASLVAAIRQPTWLHGELYSRVSRLICNGYLSRNPASPAFQRLVDVRVRLLENAMGTGGGAAIARTNGGYVLQPGLAPDSNGLIFLGTSGIGKSKAMEMVLGLWPQLILHNAYAGQPFSTIQIPWIKLDAPSDGSVLALAERFFIAIDNLQLFAGLPSSFRATYMTSRTKETTVAPDMARVAAQIGLGLLVLDEVQDLSSAKARKFLSFLVQLVNVVGVPVVLVGGLDAFHLVTEQFRQVRRGSTEGDLIVTQSEPGSRWNDFCKVLWGYQYTTEKIDMTPEHAAALFDVSQGITELLVIAYKNAQIRAISTNRRFVTPKIIRSVSDTLNLAQPALGALRRGSAFVIDRMSDLRPPPGVETQPFLRADPIVANRANAFAGPAESTDALENVAEMAQNPEEKLGSREAGGSGHRGRGSRGNDQSPASADQPLSRVAGASAAGADMGDADAAGSDRPTRGNAERQPEARGEAPIVASLAAVGLGRAPTLLGAVQEGMAKGVGTRESLISSGCGAGDLFRRITQLPV